MRAWLLMASSQRPGGRGPEGQQKLMAKQEMGDVVVYLMALE